METMTQPIASLPPKQPPTRFDDYSTEIPGLEGDSLESANFWSTDDGFSFSELLDIVNPLQHLPIISSIYRSITGDEIGIGPRLAGGVLFGGPLGLLMAGINALFEEASGGNIADHAVALFEDITGTDEKPQVAADTAATGGADKNGVVSAPPAIAAPATVLPPLKAPDLQVPAKASAATPPAAAPSAASPVEAPTFRARPTAVPRQGAGFLPPALNAPLRQSASLPAFGGGDSETRRISQKILEAQRDQAHLLLSSLSNAKPKTTGAKQRNADAEASAVVPRTTKARHDNAAPRNAPPNWYGEAMERALTKYQSAQTTRRGSAENLSVAR